MLRGHRAG